MQIHKVLQFPSMSFVRTRFKFLTQGMNGRRPKKLKTMNL